MSMILFLKVTDFRVPSSWWLISYWGRRPIYVVGMGILCGILLIIGILDVSAGDNALWPSGGLCVLWLFVYSLTIGPIAVSGRTQNSLLHILTRR